MVNHPNRSQKVERVVSAYRISGNLYDVRTSYDSTLDKMTRQEVEKFAREDRAHRIEFDRSGHHGEGDLIAETVHLR